MKEITSQAKWDAFVLHKKGHPLQLWGWGTVKQRRGWKVERYQSDSASWGAEVLIKPLPYPARSFAYIPRGLVGEWDHTSLEEIAQHIRRRHNAISLSVEPHIEQSAAKRGVFEGWKKARSTILVPRTLVVDLTQSEDELLGAMAKKTRQYIRKSLQSIEVRRVTSREDIEQCLSIYRQTAERAGFALHGDDYYFDIAEQMGEYSPIYAAYEGEVMVAFLWLITSSTFAFELYGGVNNRGQELRANYGLKWHAITDLKNKHITQYDMNGLLNDGISTFKRGFASHETQLIGTYDKPLSLWYPLWTYGLPLAKKVVRMVRR